MRIGLDVGGTKTEIVVLSENGDMVYRQRQTTPDNYPDWLTNIQSLVNAAIDVHGLVKSVGLCLPGAVSPDTGRLKNANTLYLNGREVGKDLEALLNLDIRLANDADCFALSEAIDGAAAGAASCFGIIIGTGCGGGLVFRSALLNGPNAIAGEWGHNPLPGYDESQDGSRQPCYCGRDNCIETFVSGTGMAKRFRELYDYSVEQVPDARRVMDMQAQGDANASSHFDHYVNALARSIASVINIIDPEVVVLGGGMSNVQALYDRLPREVPRYVFSDRFNTRIVQAKYGDSSGVRGAAWL